MVATHDREEIAMGGLKRLVPANPKPNSRAISARRVKVASCERLNTDNYFHD
jgi:hypothetical protein